MRKAKPLLSTLTVFIGSLFLMQPAFGETNVLTEDQKAAEEVLIKYHNSKSWGERLLYIDRATELQDCVRYRYIDRSFPVDFDLHVSGYSFEQLNSDQIGEIRVVFSENQSDNIWPSIYYVKKINGRISILWEESQAVHCDEREIPDFAEWERQEKAEKIEEAERLERRRQHAEYERVKQRKIAARHQKVKTAINERAHDIAGDSVLGLTIDQTATADTLAKTSALEIMTFCGEVRDFIVRDSRVDSEIDKLHEEYGMADNSMSEKTRKLKSSIDYLKLLVYTEDVCTFLIVRLDRKSADNLSQNIEERILKSILDWDENKRDLFLHQYGKSLTRKQLRHTRAVFEVMLTYGM